MTARCSLSAGVPHHQRPRKASRPLTAGCWSRLRGVTGRAGLTAPLEIRHLVN